MKELLLFLHKNLSSIGRLKRKIHQMLFQMRYSYNLELLHNYFKKYPELVKKLDNSYQTYITTISRPDAAISLECACLLLFLCRALRPHIILDMGSGFTSYIFRLYKKETDSSIKIFSIDDNLYWLERTRSYLSECGFSTENMYKYSRFRQEYPNMHADLIIFDLSDALKRLDMLPMLLDYVTEDTLICVDDIHKPYLRRSIEAFVRLHKLRYTDLRCYTKDQFGRYQWILSGFDSKITETT